jgi:hypothetical protein
MLVGEPRFVLQSLLGQDVQATLRWLADEARRWVPRHRRWEPVTGDVARFCADRARNAAILLDDRIAEAQDLVRQGAQG